MYITKLASAWQLLLVLVLPLRALGLSGTTFRFKLNQLYELSVGLENLRGTPAAFGDFNNNQQTDLFVITPDQKQVQIWLWNAQERQFQHLQSADITTDFAIANVVVGDFNMDGNLDVLLQGVESGSNKEVVMKAYLGDSEAGFSDAGAVPSAAGGLPFAFDYHGDGRTDLLGWPLDQNDKQEEALVWTHADSQGDVLFETSSFAAGNSTASTSSPKMCKLAAPHSSAFVDLNGDCLPDLFVVCDGNEEYQIWTNTESGFVYSQTGKLPSNAGPVSFADMNADGSIDMVIPVVGSTQIYVLYNEQRPLCVGTRKNQEGCRKYKKICEADDQFSFSLKDAQIIDIAGIWSGETILGSVDSFAVPPPARLADLNLDGYPDIALITSKSKKENHVRLLRSEACSDCLAGSNKQIDHRSYAAVTDGVDVLNTLGRPQDVAFFDIDGTGTADLLVHYLDGSGNRRVTAIYNNFFTDAFFIKARACPSTGKTRSYAGLVPGATFKYLLMSDSGLKHVAQAVQAPQSAYRALFTPYTIIGIGRTNNYIEDFSVGSTSQRGSQTRSFEGLIPNSKVVVFPVNTTDDWRLELYMNKSESTPYILATLLTAMGVLAITVVALGALERKADQRQKQMALHSINFDAL
ncbi:hypothetical protein FB645_001950 [Coemansia sp. IMI 203386]|nr:hypothetical protein FB645_001950 [Coemansia sp. IMI 203386]